MDQDAKRLVGFVGAICVSFSIGVIIGWLLKPCDCPGKPSLSSVDVRIDTVLVVKPGKNVFIRDVAAHDTVYIDTSKIYETPGFVASIDTTIGKDTVGVDFRYPDFTFSVALRNAPDSILVENRTLTITNTVIEKRPFWIDVLTHIGAAAVGYAASGLAR